MTNLGNADEERLLGVLDGPVVLFSVVLHVAQLLSIPSLELVGWSFVPGNLVNSVGFIVVTGIRKMTEVERCRINLSILPSHHNGSKDKLLGNHLERVSASLPGLRHLVKDGVSPEDLVAELAAEHHLRLVLTDAEVIRFNSSCIAM